MISAAKGEGKLTVALGPGGVPVRTPLADAFKRAFGVDLEVLVGPTQDLVTKLQLEQSAGQHTVDVVMSGANSLYDSFYGHMIQPIKPLLINPDVLNPADWTVGHPWFMDPEQQYILRITSALTGFVVINTGAVKAGELSTWQDLLKPVYTGKIASYDPTINGQGAQQAVYLDVKLGDDYVKRLFVDQKPVTSRDTKQLGDWLGRGEYGIGVGMDASTYLKAKNDGLPVDVLRLKDAPGWLTGATGMAVVMENPPHPNAAALFANWIGGTDGQTVYNKATDYPGTLTTLKNEWVPDFEVPQPGGDYIDTYEWEYAHKTYPAKFKALRQLMGGR